MKEEPLQEQELRAVLGRAGLEAIDVRQFDGECLDVEGWTKDIDGRGWCVVLTHDNGGDIKNHYYASALLTTVDGDEEGERSFSGDLESLEAQIKTLVTDWESERRCIDNLDGNVCPENA